MSNLIGLAVTNPVTKARAICTGFKSKRQAQNFGLLRSKLKGSVKNPKVVVMPKIERYELHFEHSQQDLKNELASYFEIDQ